MQTVAAAPVEDNLFRWHVNILVLEGFHFSHNVVNILEVLTKESIFTAK